MKKVLPIKKKSETKDPLTKARSLLKKAEHAHTPSSIKRRLKKSGDKKPKPKGA